MEKPIRLLIVDDNPEYLSAMYTYLTDRAEIEVVGTATNGDRALELCLQYHPNAICCDLIMPDTDGYYLLEQLGTGEYGPMPKVIILSAANSDMLHNRALELGAIYFMNKPFRMQVLYHRLLDFFGLREVPMPGRGQPVPSRSLEERITSIFLTIGIPAHIKGYQFLGEAIKLVMADHSYINHITKALYPAIAARFDTTQSKVERAIRHAIEVAWNRGRIQNLNEIFGHHIYTKSDKPTNGEFIALLADRLTLEGLA